MCSNKLSDYKVAKPHPHWQVYYLYARTTDNPVPFDHLPTRPPSKFIYLFLQLITKTSHGIKTRWRVASSGRLVLLEANNSSSSCAGRSSYPPSSLSRLLSLLSPLHYLSSRHLRSWRAESQAESWQPKPPARHIGRLL